MLRNYLKVAFRKLRHRKGYALVNSLGLTVGLVCCTMVGLFLQYEFQYDRFHEKEEDVHRVLREKTGDWWSTIPFPEYEESTGSQQRQLPRALEQQISAVESATNFYVRSDGRESPVFINRGEQRFEGAKLLRTTTGSSFFDVFTFPFLHGTPQSALSEPGTAVLTETEARKYFGRTDVLGEQFTIDGEAGRETFEVTGVIEDVPPYSHFDFEIALQVDRIRNWGAYTYFRLHPGANPDGLASRLETVMDEVRPQRVQDPQLRSALGGVRVQNLTDIHFGPRMLYDQKSHRDPRYLWGLGAIGLLILLIVLINYTNLAVALSSERRHEIGVRKAMGSGRGQLAGQFLIEALTLAVLCVPVAAAVLKGAIPLFNEAVSTQIQSNVFQSPRVLAAMLGFAVLIGGMAGSYPAWAVSREETVSLFRGSASGGGSRGWSLRHVLIGLQFTLLIGLGSLTWLVNSQLRYLQKKDLGFRTQGVVELSSVDSSSTYARLKNRLDEASAIEAAGAGIGPGPGRFEVRYRSQGSDMVRSDGDVINVTPGWFEVLGIEHPVVRRIQERSGQGPVRLLVNRAAVQSLGYSQPEGKTVVFSPSSQNPNRQAIDGVVDNFNFRPLYERVQPTFLRVHPSVETMSALSVRSALVWVDPSNLDEGIAQLQSSWSVVRPDTPFSPRYVGEQLSQLYAEERRIGTLGTGLSVVAFVLAALGLLGLSAYVTQRRTKEIGVRKALGASISDIVFRLNRDFVTLVGSALVIASPVAYFVAESWLTTFAYRISISPLVFIGVGGVALSTSLLAATYQAWSVARIDPATALRQER